MNKLVSKLKKIHQFLFNGILYSPKTLYIFLISPLIKTNFPKINWLSQTELINKIKKGESVIRLGDGEIMLITGRDIHFQKSSKSLSHELKEIVTSYNKNSKYILCLPTEALTFNEAELKKIDRLRIWRLFRAYFRDKIKNNLSYGDAHIFYRKEFLNNLTPLFKNRYVISVSHQGTIDQNFKKIMDKLNGLHPAQLCFIYTRTFGGQKKKHNTNVNEKKIMKSQKSILLII